MPGKRITHHQVTKYKTLHVDRSQQAAAAKTGISVASARRIETRRSLPSQRPPRNSQTLQDPLAEVWTCEIMPLPEATPVLQNSAAQRVHTTPARTLAAGRSRRCMYSRLQVSRQLPAGSSGR